MCLGIKPTGVAFWIAKCLSLGLLKPSFVPNREQHLNIHSHPVCKMRCLKQNNFLSAQYSQITSHRRKNRATMAVAHSMAIATFFVLSGSDFQYLGSDYYPQFNSDKKVNSQIKHLTILGISLPDEGLLDIHNQASA